MSKRMLIRINTMMGLLEMLRIAWVIMAGICSIVRIRVNAVAAPMMAIVVPLVEQALAIVLKSCFGVSSR